MTDAGSRFVYRLVGEDRLEIIRPLWERLRAYNLPMLARFPGELPPFDFGPRKQELLAKAAGGGIRIELARLASDATDIAYCVSTVSVGGRGELDSLYVEDAFRGRGVGSELARRALAWMESQGASSKVVTVVHANADALTFYTRFGFHPRLILLQQSGDSTGSPV